MRRLAGVVMASLIGGCGGATTTSKTISPPRARIFVSSPAFTAGGSIPVRFTCQGQDVSPPLRLSGVPRASRELDLVMRDPDAPGGNFVHWRLTAIRPLTQELAAGQTPPGAKPGRNDFGTTGYRGPCPPAGRAHHYVITVTATAGAAVLGQGTLTGTYARC
jgi:Raf kinase inhibitor-like YbhB/YbcL family protein